MHLVFLFFFLSDIVEGRGCEITSGVVKGTCALLHHYHEKIRLLVGGVGEEGGICGCLLCLLTSDHGDHRFSLISLIRCFETYLYVPFVPCTVR